MSIVDDLNLLVTLAGELVRLMNDDLPDEFIHDGGRQFLDVRISGYEVQEASDAVLGFLFI